MRLEGSVDNELAALKQEMSGAAARPTLPAPRPAGAAGQGQQGAGQRYVRDVLVVGASGSVDWELEELRRQARGR